MSGRFAVIPLRVINDERLNISHIRVLVALSSHSDKNGWCYPGSKKIATMIGLTPGRVRSYIGELQSFGLLEVCARFRDDGSQASNYYRVIMDGDFEPEDGSPAPLVESAPPHAMRAPPVESAGTPRTAQESAPPARSKAVRPPHAPGACTIEHPIRTPQANDPGEQHLVTAKPGPVAPAGFSRFWEAYKPAKERRTDKPRCLKLWAAQGLEARADEIVAHVQGCAASEQWKRGYAPMAATYLGQCRYDDDVPPPPQAAAGKPADHQQSFYEAEQAAKADRASQFMPSRKAAPAAAAAPVPPQMLTPGADGVLQIGGAA